MADELLNRLAAVLEGRYTIERRLGEGGMATVFLAEDLKHRRSVAIKVLLPELSASLGTERFLREIELAARLQHPHIVPVYDSGSGDGLLFYVMPCIDGESVRDLLKREGRVPLARAAELTREAASGLAYAHAHGVVHRDIKPENIMLSDGHAVVTDFGIARAVDASRAADANLTGAGIAIGTPAYMSPEQATADNVDASTDQYALACVFYEMVTGKRAFSGPTMQAMLTSMLTGPRPRMTAVVMETPPAVDAATQRALSTDPAKRFPSIMAFADAVTQESTGAAAATRESRRWKRIAIVLPMLVAAAAAAWVIFFAGPPRIVVSGAETIAVMPFTVTGAGMEGLGEGMVDLLAANLDGVGPIRAVEPRTIMREWRQRVRSGNGDLQDALAVGRSADAASVLTGSIVATGGNARLTAELYDLTGKQLARAQIDGAADSVLALADGLALELLREIWRSREPLPSANASGINSASMPAIRAYLTGERYHRRGMWDSAQVAFEESVAADSTFALSWYKLASTMGWKGQYGAPASRQAAANAVRFSAALSPRMQSLFQAYSLFSQINPAGADSARAYVSRYPTDADGWFLLGESQYHGRTYRPLPPDMLREPFDKVLALDSSLTPAAIHPMELAIEQRDTVLLNRYEAVFRLAGADDELARLATARRAIAGNDSAFNALFGNAVGAGVGLSVLRARLQAPGMDGDSVMAQASRIAAAAPSGNMGTQMRAMAGLIAGALGRDSAAAAVAATLGTESGDLGSYVRMMSLVGAFADSAKLMELKNNFSRAPANNPYVAFWSGVIDYDLGNPRAAQARIRPIIAQAGDSVPVWLVGALTTLDGLSMVALGDSVGGITRADAGLRLIGGFNAGGITVTVSLRYARLLVSYAASRAEGIRRLQYGFSTNPEVHPISRYYLGKALEASAMPDSAVAFYSDFIRLWNKAEPRYQHYVSEARSAIERLTAEAGAGPPAVAPTNN